MSEILIMRDDVYNFDEGGVVKQLLNTMPSTMRKERKYMIQCPFLDPRDNEVTLDVCCGCYWSKGVINNLEGIPVKVKCHYMYHNDFIVQVFSDYHG